MRRSLTLGTAAATVAASTVFFALPAGAATSPTVAGYSATAPSAITSFSGSLVAPTPTCPASGTVEMEMTISLSDPSGGGQASFLPFLICNAGSYSNYIAEAYVSGPTGPGSLAFVYVTPGDELKFSMVENSAKGTTTATVTDATTHFSGSSSGDFLPSMTQISAETSFCCGSGGSQNVSPIPSFTPVKYSGLKFNGAFLSTFSPTKFNMYDGSTLQVRTTPISSTTGTFSTLFVHA